MARPNHEGGPCAGSEPYLGRRPALPNVAPVSWDSLVRTGGHTLGMTFGFPRRPNFIWQAL